MPIESFACNLVLSAAYCLPADLHMVWFSRLAQWMVFGFLLICAAQIVGSLQQENHQLNGQLQIKGVCLHVNLAAHDPCSGFPGCRSSPGHYPVVPRSNPSLLGEDGEVLAHYSQALQRAVATALKHMWEALAGAVRGVSWSEFSKAVAWTAAGAAMGCMAMRKMY
jgi:hypothetical protein